jgi:DNA-damage-inducible protein D
MEGFMSEEQNNSDLSIFEQKKLRRVWHEGEWYYSIIDVIAALTDSANSRAYWGKLKERAKSEGFDEALARIEQLKLKSPDGRFRLTDTANRETLLRIIQSVPSPRAEPFRLWLARVGEERFEEIEHPEAAIERVRATYRAKGYDEAWIDARIRNDLIRNELTDEWKDRGAKEGQEFAILTNELSKGTFGMTVAVYKDYKLLPARTNLRDHMTPIELALTSLSEATAITFHRERDSQGFPELKRDTTDAGKATGDARRALEKNMGRSVVSQENHLETRKVKGKGTQEEQPPLLEE